MDKALFDQRYSAYRQAVETYLSGLFSEKPHWADLYESMRYSLLAGGKRIRPVLTLEFARLCGLENWQTALPVGCAVELVHTYSLIHDDLPCMDDDDLRRGKPSCHKAFGESTAMLAGDVLLTEAFNVVANAPASPIVSVRAARALGAGAGSHGMVYGQELDLKYEALAATEEQLRLIHRNKTGALINAAVQMGAAAAGADADQCRALEAYAYGIGLVFQIVDDVLDVTSTPEQLGKPIGSDSENGKTTFATLYGVEGAMALAQRVNEKTCSALRETFGEKSAFLEQLAQQLLTRKN